MDERAAHTLEYATAMEALRSENIEELARTKELGTSLDFSAALPQLREMVSNLESFSTDDLDRLPPQALTVMTNNCKSLIALISGMKSFGPGESNALNARRGLLDQVDQLHYQLINALAPFLAILRYRASEDISGLGSAAVAEKFASLDSNLGKSSEQLKEIEDILSKTRKFAAESVVGQQAEVFGGQAESHKKAAMKWLVALSVLLVVTLIAAITSYYYTPTAVIDANGTAAVVYVLASKSIIFGLLIFSILASARNYSAHRHNEVINTHRQNALLTYNTFVSAGSTPEMRDIVLNHASTAIYGPADTGYNKHPEAPSNMFPVVNVPLPKP